MTDLASLVHVFCELYSFAYHLSCGQPPRRPHYVLHLVVSPSVCSVLIVNAKIEDHITMKLRGEIINVTSRAVLR